MNVDEAQASFGTQPISVVPAERYVTQLWEAPDKTVKHKRQGMGSNTPKVSGEDWSSLQSLWRRSNPGVFDRPYKAPSSRAPRRLPTPPPPLSGPDSVDYEAETNHCCSFS